MGDSDSDNENTTTEIESYGHFHKLDRQYQHISARSSYDEAWYAYDDTTGTECIWNTISAYSFTEAAWEKLETRLKLLTQMNHSNICRFMGYWVTEGKEGDDKVKINFITEVMTSGSLRRYLVKNQKAKTKVQQKVWQRWCRQILSALNRLHSNNITHGNLSLDTVYIQHNGLVKVGDLWLGDLQKHVKSRTMRNDGVNTYWAPELYDESPDEDDLPSSIDIYAFGILVLEMATGDPPYKECNSYSEVYEKVINGIKPASLEKVQNPELQDMILQCLSPKETRPTAKDLLAHRFLFEVPPLKVFAAHFILRNNLLTKCQEDKRLSADDLNFLQEVESGAWGSLANVRLLPEPEKRRTAEQSSKYVFFSQGKAVGNKKPPLKLNIIMVLSDGLRRCVTCDYDASSDTPGGIVEELIYEGLMSAADRELWTRELENNLKVAAATPAATPQMREQAPPQPNQQTLAA
eukprot:comp16255_c0_seq1/m.13983 comp16255_c0_seq1/g.13983  ORF comp16255_c0_seq1/g.13983 comp16255_c0_seq1/m.13983 type:complete len:464 (-) comp16255_c0_seq1:275-1666(-)